METERPRESSLSEPDSLELEKRRLECEKLRAEIAQVSLAWWKRPGYLGGLAPIVIAVVGFLSAWTVGYFDTERRILQSEISNFENRRDQLLRTNKELQEKIDDAYLRLKAASFDAKYALSHIRSFETEYRNLLPRLEASLKGLAPDVARDVKELVGLFEQTSGMATGAEKNLDRVESDLEDIPASQWTNDLQPTPAGFYVGGRTLFKASGGRVYDPKERRYYELAELDKKRPE